MGLRITQVDAFTGRPFAGNPAAVCVLDRGREEGWMRDVAREMNLSETAFLLPVDAPGAAAFSAGMSCRPAPRAYYLRWFTPAAEVDLCGHATLASAHVLWEEGRLRPEEAARFRTRSGLLTATRETGAPPWITLDCPATPPGPVDLAAVDASPASVARALGLATGEGGIRHVARSCFDFLVEVDSEESLRSLRPDFAALAALPARGVTVTARGVGGFDFVSRFFAPNIGVNEDPVTGSVHCLLAPYWAEKLGKTEMVGRQVSARGGMVRVGLRGDRVAISGQAVTVLRAELAADV